MGVTACVLVVLSAFCGVVLLALHWVSPSDEFVVGPGSRRLRELPQPLTDWVEREYERTGSFPDELLPEHAALLDGTGYTWVYSQGMLRIGHPGEWPDPLYGYYWQLQEGWTWWRDPGVDDEDQFLIERGYSD